MFATGSPLLAWVDAISAVLTADATLLAIATSGIFAALPRNTRTDPPYIIVGRRELTDQGGAMQIAGGKSTLTIDFWSSANGPAETQQMQSRVRALLERRNVPISGFAMISGSMTCSEELVFPDFDPDMPERTLFHGVQQWTADLEESS